MKHVLLAVVGLSPQVVTEALYALLHDGRVVDRLEIITTGQGAGEVNRFLLTPGNNRIDLFCQEYGLPPVEFGPQAVHVLSLPNGEVIDDIKNAEDNEQLLRLCLELAFQSTSDPDVRVSFLVAGGRKTMTSCLTLAAQLYGRPCDRLYHVLVAPEFENSRDFWFPPRESVLLKLKDGNGEVFFKETRYAHISLIPIPFVSIREQLAASVLDRPRSPADLMQSLIREEHRRLRIDLRESKISFGVMERDLHPARLALYAFFAEQKTSCKQARSCAGCDECWLDAPAIVADRRIVELYKRIPTVRYSEIMGDSGITRLSKEDFRSYRSKIRKDLCAAFGHSHIEELEISATGERPDTRYGIRLDKDRIAFSDR